MKRLYHNREMLPKADFLAEFPEVVESDAVPKGEVLCTNLRAIAEAVEQGESLESAIARYSVKIVNIGEGL